MPPSRFATIASAIGQIVGAAAAAMIGASIGAVLTAGATSSLAAFGGAVFASASVAGGLGWTAVRASLGRPTRRRWVPAIAAGCTLGGMIVLVVASLVLPAASARSTPSPPRAHRWRLPTGSTIAYDVARPDAATRPAGTVLYLHGGPGVPGEPGGSVLDGLTHAGFTVYHYDQVGSGQSSRLADPRQYTVQRQVDDLDAIRKEVGAGRIVLVGESWGALLAMAYAHDNPHDVQALVLVSPALLRDAPPRDHGAPSEPGTPRMYAYQLLAMLGPRLARELVPDREADGVAQRAFSQRHDTCGTPRMPLARTGIGYLANLRTNIDLGRHPIPASALADLQAPTLIVRGSCDWVPVRTAIDLLEAANPAHASFACIPAAGHAVPAFQPRAYVAAISEFLAHPEARTTTVDATLRAARACT